MQWTLSAITSTIAFNENLNSIELIEKRLNKKGLKDFLNNDFSQFFVKDIGKVLYSKGGDGFVLPNGTAYIGYYHIMADGTPMTGRSHNKGNNIVLTQRSVHYV